MKHVKLQKPDLAEILSAFGGIGCAAIAVTINEDIANKAIKEAARGKSDTILHNDWPRHPLCVLEAGLSDIRYDSRHKLILGSDDTDQITLQDEIAKKALAALAGALPILKAHEDFALMRYAGKFNQKSPDPEIFKGGSVRDVVAHIESMLERESKGEERTLIYATNAGAISPSHTPSYMPKSEKKVRGKSGEMEKSLPDQFVEAIQAELQLAL